MIFSMGQIKGKSGGQRQGGDIIAESRFAEPNAVLRVEATTFAESISNPPDGNTSMNTDWQESLLKRGANISHGCVTDFGNLADELIATQQQVPVLVPLAHLALMECVGEDAKTFLHNQLTSDVNHLAAGTAQYSTWCTAKGRMQASFILFPHSTGYRALLSADLLEATLKRLQIFVLRSKVKLGDLSGNHELLGLAGLNIGQMLCDAGLPVPNNPMETVDFSQGTVIRLDPSRFIVAVNATAAATLWEKLAKFARPAGTPVWEWLDIQTGIARVLTATKEEFVPQMANFDKIGGVSFHKGCYPGQEVVARAKYLGKIKRHLYRIHTDGPVAPGASLYQADDREHPCGLVANASPAPGGGYAALAIIKESVLESNETGNTKDTVSLKIPGVTVSNIESITA